MRTAISLEQGFLKRINDLAREMEFSPSRLFVLAVEEFLHKNKNQKLLRQINAETRIKDFIEEENSAAKSA